jgi:hypothetical protein
LVSIGAASRSTTISSTIVISFSISPPTNAGNNKKTPINKNGTNPNSELIDLRSEEFGGIQYHVCGLSFSCNSRSALKAVPVALNAVVHGDTDDGRVKDGEGMLVLVGSARAIGISMAERRRRARRIAIRVAPGLVAGMLALMVVVVSMACSAWVLSA